MISWGLRQRIMRIQHPHRLPPRLRAIRADLDRCQCCHPAPTGVPWPEVERALIDRHEWREARKAFERRARAHILALYARPQRKAS